MTFILHSFQGSEIGEKKLTFRGACDTSSGNHLQFDIKIIYRRWSVKLKVPRLIEMYETVWQNKNLKCEILYYEVFKQLTRQSI